MSVNRPPAVPSLCRECAACRARGALHGPWRARRAHGDVPATTAHLRLASAAHAFAAATHSLAGLQQRVQAVQPGLRGAGHGGGVAAGGAAHAAPARAQGGVYGLPAAHASVAGARMASGAEHCKAVEGCAACWRVASARRPIGASLRGRVSYGRVLPSDYCRALPLATRTLRMDMTLQAERAAAYKPMQRTGCAF